MRQLILNVQLPLHSCRSWKLWAILESQWLSGKNNLLVTWLDAFERQCNERDEPTAWAGWLAGDPRLKQTPARRRLFLTLWEKKSPSPGPFGPGRQRRGGGRRRCLRNGKLVGLPLCWQRWNYPSFTRKRERERKYIIKYLQHEAHMIRYNQSWTLAVVILNISIMKNATFCIFYLVK